jgi:hypothetical protein
MTYYVYSVMTKKIVHRCSGKNVAFHVLSTYNKQRGELSFAVMDKETYEQNYGNEMVLREE